MKTIESIAQLEAEVCAAEAHYKEASMKQLVFENEARAAARQAKSWLEELGDARWRLQVAKQAAAEGTSCRARF